MVDFISMITGWLATSLFDKVLYGRIMSVLGRNAFQSLSDKALQEILKKEDNRIVWNEIMTVKDLKIGDPKEFNPCQICNLLHEEYQELCQNFFQEWREEYLNQIHISASKDPVLKTLLEEKKQSFDLKKRLERVKEGIERKKVDISDFVGRRDIIGNYFAIFSKNSHYEKANLHYCLSIEDTKNKRIINALLKCTNTNRKVFIYQLRKRSYTKNEFSERNLIFSICCGNTS